MENNDEIMVFKLEAIETPELKEVVSTRKEYVMYGADNAYPVFLWKLYNECSEHQSIIDGIAQYVIGNGLKTTNESLNNFFKNVNEDENINDLLKKLVLDYLIFGGFVMDVVPDRTQSLKYLKWVDFMSARVSEDENTVYISKDWGKWSVILKPYKNFTKKNINSEQIFYFKGNKTRGVYPIPLYNGAIKAIQTAIEIGNFHLNNISNGFQVNTIINFNNGIPLKEEKEAIEQKIKEKFSGTSGAKIMTTFNESKEKSAEVQKLNADNFGEQFQSLHKNTQNTIFTAHRVTSPALFGIKMEGTGFSKTEFAEAFEIFNETVISSIQLAFIDELYKVLSLYFTMEKSDIMFEPFTINVNNINE